MPILVLLLATTSAALADPPTAEPSADLGYSGSSFFPDARARTPGSAEVALGGFGVLVLPPANVETVTGEPQTLGGVAVRAAWAPATGVRVEGHLGYASNGAVLGTVAASASAALSKTVRLGGYGLCWDTADPNFWALSGGCGIGVALAARWPRWGFDANVPVVMLSDIEGLSSFLPVLMTEAHFTFALGHGHSVRVGSFSVGPGVGWQFQGRRLLLRADVHSFGLVSGLRVEAGVPL